MANRKDRLAVYVIVFLQNWKNLPPHGHSRSLRQTDRPVNLYRGWVKRFTLTAVNNSLRPRVEPTTGQWTWIFISAVKGRPGMGLSLVPHCSMSLWQLQGITVCGLQEAPARSEATKAPNLQERLMDNKKNLCQDPVKCSRRRGQNEWREAEEWKGGVGRACEWTTWMSIRALSHPQPHNPSKCIAIVSVLWTSRRQSPD